ncbi:MAG: molybdopterin converting factor subunit 1 [Gemmatimonadota bacterium]
MELDVLFFASYRDLVGTPRLRLTLPAEATVGDLVSLVRARDGGFSRLPERPAVAVNQEVARPGRPLRQGDEVAFLPPVAGG